jgi:4-carboxymuconolactone decarboxylase
MGDFALIAMNRPDQLRSHLTRARENGVTLDELVETITHPAFRLATSAHAL